MAKTYHPQQTERLSNCLCLRCGAKLGETDGKLNCRKCIDYLNELQRERRKRYAAQSFCQTCKAAIENGKKQCDECLKMRSRHTKTYKQRRVVNGLCVCCGKDALKTVLRKSVTHCYDCFFKKIANERLGRYKDWEILKEKFETQNGKCAYTGVEMDLGKNASLDHIKPVSRYPELANDVNNVQWVLTEVNFMKRNFEHERFIEIAKLIALKHK